METYNEVQALFEQVMAGRPPLDREALDGLTKTIQEAAREEYGDGIHIRGVIDTDRGGVVMKWRRPSCRQRWDFFMEIDPGETPLPK